MNAALCVLAGCLVGGFIAIFACELVWVRREQDMAKKQAGNLQVLKERIEYYAGEKERFERARASFETVRAAADAAFERNKRFMARVQARAEHGEPPEG